MKIATNFVRPVQQAVMPVVMAMWIAVLGLGAAAWWLVDDAAQLRGQLPQLRQRLERIEKQGSAVAAPAHLPSVGELAQTRDRVAKINAAAQAKGLPTLALLSELGAQMPPEVWLTSVHYRAVEGEVLLVAAAPSADPLSAFLLKLESDPLFDEVMLIREIQPARAGQPVVQFEIRLKVRS